MNEEVMRVAEAGRRLGLSRISAYNAVRRGELPALRFGRRLVIPRKVVDRMLETGRRPANEREDVQEEAGQ